MAGSPVPTNWSSIGSPSVQRSQSVSLIKYYFALCRVLGQVSCEVTQPKPNRPTEGQLFINLELSPMASPAFEAGRLVLINVITIRCHLNYWTLIWDITSNLILTFPIHPSLNSWTPFWSSYKLVNGEITKNYDMWTAELTYPYTHKKEIILLWKDSHCISLRKHPFLLALCHWQRFAWKFHTDDANQCLHNKSGSHGVSNKNLSDFMCLLVDFGKVLCSSAKELQQNSNTSSGEDLLYKYWLFC